MEVVTPTPWDGGGKFNMNIKYEYKFDINIML